MLIELVKYLIQQFKSKAGSADITIVRRYATPCGYNSEIFVDGRYYCVGSDNFIDHVELFKHSLKIGFEGGKRVLRTDTYLITNGDFTAKVPYNTCLVGSLEPHLNARTLSDLIETVQNKQYLRLTVLNREWAEA